MIERCESMNAERFFETETPDILLIKGGREMRFYPVSGWLTVSKQKWKNSEGAERMGKSVSVNLKENKRNEDLIGYLKDIITYLEKE